ncbi:ATPase/histidine kinase/DNA gyrase B/HSP90 domain protein [delta proteobacterium NaphS2]|nr:ATPase/histidine kinase/DNA gyrase B/HSP90 domain protein [delta proteobacterium NaphS2]
MIASGGLFLVAYYVIHNLVEQREKEIVQDRIQEYLAWFAEGGIRALKARFDQQANPQGDIFFVRIVGPLNQVLFLKFPQGFEGLDPRRLKGMQPGKKDFWFSLEDASDKGAWTVGMASLPGGITLQVGKSSVRSRELLSYFKTVFLIFMIPVLLLGVIGGSMVTFRAIKPIRSLIETVKNILRTGKMSLRVPVRKERGEMDELVGLFNEMLDKNDSLIQAMHNSLDNVAHDLRTPMTRLRGVAEFALQDATNREACREALGDCMEESERVLTMLNTLMDVAEAETGVMRLQKTALSLSHVIEDVVDLYEIVAEEQNTNVHLNLDKTIMIQADRTRLQQVLANLLDNALKYGGKGGTVSVESMAEGAEAVISVSDKGMGIAENEISRIWERLYRGDYSRSRRGLGLGLSFVKAIVEAHGGSVQVKSRLREGSTFIVKLPRLKEKG